MCVPRFRFRFRKWQITLLNEYENIWQVTNWNVMQQKPSRTATRETAKDQQKKSKPFEDVRWFFFSVLLASIDWCKGDMLVCVPKHMEISVLFVNACGCWSDMSGSGDGYRYRHLKTYFGPHFIRMRAINLVSPWNCLSISSKVVYLSPVEEIHRMILSCDTITSFSFNLFLDLSLSPFVSSP